MPTTKKYIAIDLGAESGRVMLGTVSDSNIQLEEIHRFPNLQVTTPTNNGQSQTLHWDILRLFGEIKTGLAKIADAHDPSTIAGIGVDTWGVDFALLDQNGALLANPVAYRDPRTNGMIEHFFSTKLLKQKVDAITGIQTMFLNSLFQLHALQNSNSPQLAITKHILFLPDLLTFWLSGHLGTDYTIASTSQMLDAKTRQFSPQILAALNLDKSLFPPISIPGTKESIRGPLLPSANEKLAAANIPVIAVGGHDTACAVAAVPACQDNWLYLSSGTWSLLGAEIDQPLLSDLAIKYNVTNEGGIGGATGKIRLLKNLSGLFLLQECRRQWQSENKNLDYTQITQLAEEATPNTALLNLDDPNFSTPGNMQQKITTHCLANNQPAPTTPGQFARVILESLAHTYAQVVHQLEEITQKKYATLHIVGGGSQNNLLNQLAANATKMTVIAGPVEATALGNILTQAITTRQIPNLQAARHLLTQSLTPKTFTPHNGN